MGSVELSSATQQQRHENCLGSGERSILILDFDLCFYKAQN